MKQNVVSFIAMPIGINANRDCPLMRHFNLRPEQMTRASYLRDHASRADRLEDAVECNNPIRLWSVFEFCMISMI